MVSKWVQDYLLAKGWSLDEKTGDMIPPTTPKDLTLEAIAERHADALNLAFHEQDQYGTEVRLYDYFLAAAMEVDATADARLEAEIDLCQEIPLEEGEAERIVEFVLKNSTKEPWTDEQTNRRTGEGYFDPACYPAKDGVSCGPQRLRILSLHV